MQHVFIDECHSTIQGKPYTATVASVWDAASLRRFRDEFIQAISSQVNIDLGRINPFPTIHASEMAKEYGDDVKLFCFETISTLSRRFGVRFYRVGYFHHAPFVTNFDPLSLSVNQLCFCISYLINDEVIFVYELNKSKHDAIMKAFNDWNLHYYRNALGPENITVENADLIIGAYYCDKQNYHMCVTDTAAYVINAIEKISDGTEPSDFRCDLISRTKELVEQFVMNEVIQLNSWPWTPSGNGPARYMHPITPSDDKDLSTQFQEFLGRLEDYWTRSR